MTQGPPTDDSAVRAALERVLARPEFGESPLERLAAWLSERLGGPDVGRVELAIPLREILLGVLAALLAALVVARLAQRRGRPGAGARAEAPGAAARRRAEELAEQAREARAAGELARALRLYFTALVIGLGRRGDLEYRDAWTNRELLERGRPSADVRALLAPLVDELDAKGFGAAPTGEDDVERLAALCRDRLGVPA